MAFQIVRNDITKIKADAIVNTANPKVEIGGGVETAIYNAAGREELLSARREVGELAVGEVAVTPAYALDAKIIVHVSGPWWQDGNSGEKDLLRMCYDRALSAALENGCESIAFPALSTGTYGFPKEVGIQIAVDAFTAFLEEHEMEITLVVFGSEEVSVSGALVDEVRSFIDDEHVTGAKAAEYAQAPRRSLRGLFGGRRERSRSERVGRQELEDTAKSERGLGAARRELEEAEDEGVFGAARQELEEERVLGAARQETEDERVLGAARQELEEAEDEGVFGVAPEQDEFVGATLNSCSVEKLGAPQESLEDALKNIYTDTFAKHLQQLINKKGLKNSQVYAAANISKQYFSKLINGQVKPSKEKVLALAIGLRLNMDEAVDFLKIAGYAFSPISQTDTVVEYFIRRKEYNVIKIDIVLFDYGLESLSGV